MPDKTKDMQDSAIYLDYALFVVLCLYSSLRQGWQVYGTRDDFLWFMKKQMIYKVVGTGKLDTKGYIW